MIGTTITAAVLSTVNHPIGSSGGVGTRRTSRSSLHMLEARHNVRQPMRPVYAPGPASGLRHSD